MLKSISNAFYRLPHRIQQPFERGWYALLSMLDRDADMIFMNYGWASLDPDAPKLELKPEDESNRYCIQLYHRVASAIDLHGLDVLEVGSGRGGGAAFVKRYLEPRTMVGLDRTARAVAFSRRHHDMPGLSFVQGDAQDLDFEPESFDAVINVESSHCYPEIEQFFSGVHRVLKPGGHMLYVDHRFADFVPTWRQQIRDAGFEIIEEEPVHEQVVHALELDNARKQELISRKIPRLVQPFFHEFAGIEGSQSQYATLCSGEKQYIRFVLRKA